MFGNSEMLLNGRSRLAGVSTHNAKGPGDTAKENTLINIILLIVPYLEIDTSLLGKAFDLVLVVLFFASFFTDHPYTCNVCFLAVTSVVVPCAKPQQPRFAPLDMDNVWSRLGRNPKPRLGGLEICRWGGDV
jgi:hypothetical protein